MFKSGKISFFTLYFIILSALFVTPAYAETGTFEQDGISVSYSTDKEQYNEADEITATLKVTNNNAETVYNVELEGAAPEGFEVAESSLKYQSIAELKTGESRELETIYLKSKRPSESEPDKTENEVVESGNGTSSDNNSYGRSITDTPKKDAEDKASKNNSNSSNKTSPTEVKKNSTSKKNESSPTTGDDQPVFVYILVALVAGALIIFLTRGKWKKLFSLFLVLTMLETLVPGFDLEVKAANNEIQVMTNANVGGENVAFTATVKYSLSEPNDRYDEDNVGEIYFEPTEEEHIAVSEDGTSTYADNELLVVAKSGVSKTEVMNLAAKYEAEVVGFIEQTRDYQWKFEDIKSKSELDDLIKNVKAEDLVEDAYENYLASYSDCAVDEVVHGEKWRDDLSKASDTFEKSWGVETINAPAAWDILNECKSRISPVRIGLVDSCFDESHEDLDFADNGIRYNSPGQNGEVRSDYREHGTHVAGIMAAVGTNTEGINGVYPYGKDRLFGVSSSGVTKYKENGNGWESSMCLKVAFAELIVRNVKVINHSQGFNWQDYFEKFTNYKSLDELYAGFSKKDAYSTKKREEAMKYADFLKRALDLGYDFVIVTAAGNTGKRDAEYFSYNNLIPNNSQYEDVYNRIIVVGSIGRLNSLDVYGRPDSFEKYIISDFTDTGIRVDIFAPGECIYSTVPYGEKYDYIQYNDDGSIKQFWSGTSMAAPHVAGVCADVWSIDNGFSGETVKKIVTRSLLKDEHGKIRYPYTGRGIVDCKQAVSNAIYESITGKKGSIPKTGYGLIEGWVFEPDFLGGANKSAPIADAVIKVYDRNGEEVQLTAFSDDKNGQENTDIIKTDNEGHYEIFIPQGTYSITASKDKFTAFDSGRIDGVVVESEQVCYVRPLVLEFTDETVVSMLNEFIDKKECMYGKACTFTLQRDQNNGMQYDRWWDGISEGVVLGYSIEDFDNDFFSELLVVTLCKDNTIQFEMYEVKDGEVTLADWKPADTQSDYGTVELPCGSRTDGGICGLLSCFVQESNNRIFLQSSDSYGLVADGCDTFIVSARYTNGRFEEYAVTYNVGSSIDESIPRLNSELSDIGVPNPDFYSMFYNTTPLIDCFDGGVHEILRAEQGTLEYERDGSGRIRIVTTTVFATKDGQLDMPELYIAGNDQGVESETSDGEISYNEYGNPDWFETHPYWKHSNGQFVCCVTGNTGADLTFDFSDGVYLRGDICSYGIKEDGTIVYGYKKGWAVAYDPETGTLLSSGGNGYSNSLNGGSYYPISEEEYNNLRNELENNR